MSPLLQAAKRNRKYDLRADLAGAAIFGAVFGMLILSLILKG